MPTDDVLSRNLRVMRRVDPAEAPLPGVLAVAPELGTVVLIDTEQLPAGWPGWATHASGHVWSPLDVLRRPDGHDVVMSPCSERVEAFLTRRDPLDTVPDERSVMRRGAGIGIGISTGTSSRLDDGERITVAVSILRGFAELCAIGCEDSPGTWWLTAQGMPVFAGTAHGEPARDSSAEILRTLAAGSTSLAGVLKDAADAIAQHEAFPRALGALEERLFAITAPAPLATALPRARAASVDAVPKSAADAASLDPERSTLLEHLGRRVDADLADLVSRMTTALWRRARPRSGGGGKRRPIVAAGVIAAGVLAVGMLWPSGGPATADADGSSGSTENTASTAATSEDVAVASATDATAAQTADSATEAVADPVEDSSALTAVASELLTRRTTCNAEAACLALLQEDPGTAVHGGAIDLAAPARTVSLIDEFGGAAVLRVTPTAEGQASQLIVIVQVGSTWLLRDVYDVAEQP